MEKHEMSAETKKRLTEEKSFTGEELIGEIYPVLTDYFECKQIAVKDGAVVMEFYNGQRFAIKAEQL